ncbi:hypothetical protein L207DRAFT_627891 [Hyaloscypha variabilis F]|uniref:Ubiquitin 3 binding protein But2 C-terminal domain-containing protein n=1 Tax=Hyaloscypha variabilis (strain UAMH 11265 / GT02V1 / F) TaxID=1149755 RepID=A0A2J6S8W2_HYAVF|nr:hypothetical protein L207DRAFT_627891 [Hyaloscypha variabilis F]
MYLSTICSLAASLAFVSAAPTKRYDTVDFTFNGAGDAAYTISVPFDGQSHDTDNIISISSVSVPSDCAIDISAQCTLTTVDVDATLVAQGPGVWTIGPPSIVISSILCTETISTPPPSYVTIEFDGANPSEGASFSLNIPLDGAAHNVNNALSISAVVETYGSIDLSTNCEFVGVNSNTAPAAAPVLSAAGSGRWQVGPPQTILSVACFLHANPGH